ncbi:hypothetical protein QZH41_005351 [Actinostola sp. cb2023]|nr:hypothetical protein QZH41_005351 [Actinostola sp. cb2023]
MAVKMEDKSDKSKLYEEKLRENCCIGDEAKVKSLLDKGVNVNAANRINGWTPLHWAAKRGHKDIVELLLKEGAVTTSKTKKGETAAALANNQEIKELIGVTEEDAEVSVSLPIVPNYIKNPPFMYANNDSEEEESAENGETLPFGLGRNLLGEPDISLSSPTKHHVSKSPLVDSLTSPPRKTIALDVGSPLYANTNHGSMSVSSFKNVVPHPELVLKVRVTDSQEEDFIEIELHPEKLSYENLLEICCHELGIEHDSIRKLSIQDDEM